MDKVKWKVKNSLNKSLKQSLATKFYIPINDEERWRNVNLKNKFINLLNSLLTCKNIKRNHG